MCWNKEFHLAHCFYKQEMTCAKRYRNKDRARRWVAPLLVLDVELSRNRQVEAN